MKEELRRLSRIKTSKLDRAKGKKIGGEQKSKKRKIVKYVSIGE